jgi:hypothetical protein
VTEAAEQPAGQWLLAGRYRVDGSLGRGGMSEVFHGYDERLDRRVAIKLLRPPTQGSVPAAPDSPETAEILDALKRDRTRFLREIRTTAQLEHPGTPAVDDTGVETAPDGSTQLWLIMQLLRGSTMEVTLDRTNYVGSPPSPAWAAAIAAVLARRPPGRHRPPGHQASQRDARRRWPGEGARRRHRDPARRGSTAAAHTGRPDRRHTGVHVAGAVSRAGGDLRVRHLLTRLPTVRATHR